MTAEDWPRVEAIFAAGITGGEATFETVTPSWEQFDASKIAEARLVAVDDTGTVVGWVAASRVSAREVYRGVIEHSVYVDPAARRQGIGRLLLDAFVTAADEAGYWAIQSSVFPENTTSLNLHARADRPLPARPARGTVEGHGAHRAPLYQQRRRLTLATRSLAAMAPPCWAHRRERTTSHFCRHLHAHGPRRPGDEAEPDGPGPRGVFVLLTVRPLSVHSMFT